MIWVDSATGCWWKVMDDGGGGRPSVVKTARMLFQEDGWRGFYRGFGPRFLNMSLYGTTMIVTYELISIYIFSPDHLIITIRLMDIKICVRLEQKIEVERLLFMILELILFNINLMYFPSFYF